MPPIKLSGRRKQLGTDLCVETCTEFRGAQVLAGRTDAIRAIGQSQDDMFKELKSFTLRGGHHSECCFPD